MILIAEDNLINQKVALLTLKRGGYELVDVVSNGREAVEACRNKNYDVVLMDCQMPGMNGFEATREIRKLQSHQPVIVAVTACAIAGDREKCLASGMNEYVSKPYQPEQLLEAIKISLAKVSNGIRL